VDEFGFDVFVTVSHLGSFSMSVVLRVYEKRITRFFSGALYSSSS